MPTLIDRDDMSITETIDDSIPATCVEARGMGKQNCGPTSSRVAIPFEVDENDTVHRNSMFDRYGVGNHEIFLGHPDRLGRQVKPDESEIISRNGRGAPMRGERDAPVIEIRFRARTKESSVREMLHRMAPRIFPVVENLAPENAPPNPGRMLIPCIFQDGLARHDGIKIFDLEGHMIRAGFAKTNT